MNIEKIREQFVGWVESLNVGYDVRFAEFSGGLNDGEFYDADVQGLWVTWQASRAAIEVELPIPKELCGPDGSYMEYFEPEQIERSIESLGLKVKS